MYYPGAQFLQHLNESPNYFYKSYLCPIFCKPFLILPRSIFLGKPENITLLKHFLASMSLSFTRDQVAYQYHSLSKYPVVGSKRPVGGHKFHTIEPRPSSRFSLLKT